MFEVICQLHGGLSLCLLKKDTEIETFLQDHISNIRKVYTDLKEIERATISSMQWFQFICVCASFLLCMLLLYAAYSTRNKADEESKDQLQGE